ncbi:MAG: hypothetical protein ABI559_09615 [Chloroflexota bacterium]
MLFRSGMLSIAFWIVFIGGLRMTVVPPEDCGTADVDTLQSSAIAAAQWMERAQNPDGTFAYEYNAETDTLSPEYNEVRHAALVMALYEAAGRLDDPTALQVADQGLKWEQDHLARKHDWALLTTDATGGSTGSNALMLVGLTERRSATGDKQYDDLMHEVARLLTAVLRDDGSFSPGWDLAADEMAPGTSLYYQGESTWALTLMANAFPGEGWDTAARRAMEYIATRRDDDENVKYPPWADQWAGYSLGEIARWGGLTDAEIDYAHRLAARFGLLVRTEAQREGSWYGSLLRGRDSRGAGAGTWIEGLAGIWRASKYDNRLDDIKQSIVERTTCIAGIMAKRQQTGEQAEKYAEPSLVEGAWFRDGVTRMDDQQHTFSGLIYTIDILQNNPIRESLLQAGLSP